MHHVLANSSTGCKAVDCGRKNGVSGQPIAVARRRFVPTNDRDLGLSKIAFLRIGWLVSRLHTVDGIPVGISGRVSV